MAEEQKSYNLLCMVCGEAAYNVTEAFECCPKCQDTGTPADLDQMDTITLTKQELRILTFWSDAYARLYYRMGLDPNARMSCVLKTIFDRIAMQTDTPLSYMQDIADMRYNIAQKFGDNVELIAFDGQGHCMECGADLDVLDEQSLFDHKCGDLDELSSPEEEETPPQPS